MKDKLVRIGVFYDGNFFYTSVIITTMSIPNSAV